MSERNVTIPTPGGQSTEAANKGVKEEVKSKELTREEAEYIEKVFFEEDDTIRLRDGRSYKIPPLTIKDGRKLMERLNSIDTGVIVYNLIADDSGEDNYDALMEVLLMAFKPYYKEVTAEYLAEYVDLETARKILDIMIGLNGLKKSL